ncbi:hypothetical protein VNO80_20502 [Phaseolus coccineus]|uniref:Uncharacterized protein n=1 Tax=Phaseolus coccineus TaxID=3886 RepID=A0AAN9M1H0_PHACN
MERYYHFFQHKAAYTQMLHTEVYVVRINNLFQISLCTDILQAVTVYCKVFKIILAVCYQYVFKDLKNKNTRVILYMVGFNPKFQTF